MNTENKKFEMPNTFYDLTIHELVETEVGNVAVCSAHAENLGAFTCVAVQCMLVDGTLYEKAMVFDQAFYDKAKESKSDTALIAFIKAHEIGHHVHGHKVWPWTTFSTVLNNEAEADAYAFKKLGLNRWQSAAMLNTAYKLVDLSLFPKGAIVGITAEKTYRILNAIFRKR